MQPRNVEPDGGSATTKKLDADSGTRVVRLSINLNPESADVLREYANRKGISITEAVRRAIGALSFLDESQSKGASVLIKQGNDTKEVVLLV